MLRTMLSLRSPRLNSNRFLGVSVGSGGMKRSFIRGGGAIGGPFLRSVDDCESALRSVDDCEESARECIDDAVECIESPRECVEYVESARESVESVR